MLLERARQLRQGRLRGLRRDRRALPRDLRNLNFLPRPKAHAPSASPWKFLELQEVRHGWQHSCFSGPSSIEGDPERFEESEQEGRCNAATCRGPLELRVFSIRYLLHQYVFLRGLFAGAGSCPLHMGHGRESYSDEPVQTIYDWSRMCAFFHHKTFVCSTGCIMTNWFGITRRVHLRASIRRGPIF